MSDTYLRNDRQAQFTLPLYNCVYNFQPRSKANLNIIKATLLRQDKCVSLALCNNCILVCIVVSVNQF